MAEAPARGKAGLAKTARDATMSEPQVPSEITHILEALSRGEPQAARELLPLVYKRLYGIRNLPRESQGNAHGNPYF